MQISVFSGSRHCPRVQRRFRDGLQRHRRRRMHRRAERRRRRLRHGNVGGNGNAMRESSGNEMRRSRRRGLRQKFASGLQKCRRARRGRSLLRGRGS